MTNLQKAEIYLEKDRGLDSYQKATIRSYASYLDSQEQPKPIEELEYKDTDLGISNVPYNGGANINLVDKINELVRELNKRS